ncbi:MAG: ATP-dependent DNA helicase RecG [Solirubrobacterales bacterium]
MEAALDGQAAGSAPGAPRAIGSGAPVTREELLGAPVRWPDAAALEAPLTTLRGAGPKLAEAAAELGIESVGDLLRHIPHGYRDRSAPVRLGDLKLGEEATVEVEVRGGVRARPTRRRGLTILEAKVADASGTATATWFNRAWLADRLAPGARLLLRGKLEKRGFTVTEHELLGGDGGPAGLHTTGLVPVHPASERIRPQRLREWAWQARGRAREAPEPLPSPLRLELGYPSAGDALAAAHFPATQAAAELARRRLAFEELALYQASLMSRRARRRESRRAATLPPAGEAVGTWLESLPFEPTADQLAAFDEIDADLATDSPMQRLLMGEVGSGKTLVALYAMLRAAEAGTQAALMAPTETLAEQHFGTLVTLLGSSAVPVALITGATPAPERRAHLMRLAGGEPCLTVGTHALIEPDVAFAALSVAVIDEQHRFGVRQRAALDAKGPGGLAPHVLHMTATPIPRTLSLTAYGDLDATALRELPRGRRPVRTWVVGEGKREGAYGFLRERLREGRQAFVVCPLVSESEAQEAKAAEAEAKRLAAGPLREFRVGVLHGQMPSAAKGETMRSFAARELDVLVATSVIEVGIDVPNATVMVVEGAERYGLSQLHQLRGRVGRGEHPSACILFAGAESSEAARARMEAIASERDGFALAEVDLSIRGEGELLGTRQHGLPRFRAAVLPDDQGLLLRARAAVIAMLDRHGSLDAPALGPLMDEARRRYGDERAARISA